MSQAVSAFVLLFTTSVWLACGPGHEPSKKAEHVDVQAPSEPTAATTPADSSTPAATYGGELESISLIFASRLSCRAITTNNFGLCDNEDCKALLLGVRSRCQTTDCEAMVLGIPANCSSDDCRAVTMDSLGLCRSRICRAIVSSSPALCPSVTEG